MKSINYRQAVSMSDFNFLLPNMWKTIAKKMTSPGKLISGNQPFFAYLTQSVFFFENDAKRTTNRLWHHWDFFPYDAKRKNRGAY